MENLKKLSDEALLSLTKSKAQYERNLTLEIIDLLSEIQSRSLHVARGYSSLHEYCVKELKYSDGAAFRRIKAMKLVAQIPEVQRSIEQGKLSLTVASQAQVYFEAKAKNDSPCSAGEKMEILRNIENKSRREVEKVFSGLAPEIIRVAEKVRPVSEDKVRLDLVVSAELHDKLEKLRILTSHRNANLTDLIEYLADRELSRRNPKNKTSPEKLVDSGQGAMEASDPRTEEGQALQQEIGSGRFNLREEITPSKRRRYIPLSIRRHIWNRDGFRCTYVDVATGRRCEGTLSLQIDHIKPFSRGGANELENLRLLCAAHNRLEAIQKLGPQVMGRYLDLQS
jgi:hypothetical protein